MQVSMVVGERLQGNRIFSTDDSDANRDGCLEQFAALKARFEVLGATISTNDLIDPRQADAVLYHNVPRELPDVSAAPRSYLFFIESPIIRPRNFRVDLHVPFSKIFTNADALIDGKRYFKVNFSFAMPDSIQGASLQERKLCTTIAAHKRSSRPGEIYSERVAAIRWFERNHPESFDLYGQGWNEPVFSGRLGRILRRLPRTARCLLAEQHRCYRGTVKRKRDILSRYRFAIAYENVANSPGHITEKIFDCMFAGCIPVYLGSPNIADRVDPECFLDRRKYRDYRDLYEQMTSFTDREYRRRIDAIELYLRSERAAEFTNEYFARTVADQIVGDNR